MLGGLATSFVSACLQGADFETALLESANLTSAAVAQQNGTINVKVKMGWPMTEETVPQDYAATKGIEAATKGNTICPDGSLGACTAAQQKSDHAPKAWPVVTKIHREMETA